MRIMDHDENVEDRLALIKRLCASEIALTIQRAGLTQNGVAAKVQLSQSDVSAIVAWSEASERRFTVDRLLKVLMRLGRSPILTVW